MRASWAIFAANMDWELTRFVPLIVVAVITAAIAFAGTLAVTQRRTRVRDEPTPLESDRSKPEGAPVAAAWWDKYLVPIVVSVVSGLLTAGITALLGGRSAP